MKLGLFGASAPDDMTTSLVADGIASADTVVRERSIYAAFLLKWPAFQQPLAAGLEREEREDLRRMLEAAALVHSALESRHERAMQAVDQALAEIQASNASRHWQNLRSVSSSGSVWRESNTTTIRTSCA